MQTFNTDIQQVRSIAWALSVASARDQLDIPGEYTWAFPQTDLFADVRHRSQSIFSSGNSIKDPEIIAYIQSQNISHHMQDPWIVEKFEQRFPDWIQTGTRYKLKNFDLFQYVGFSAGTQESFINFYLMNKDCRFRVFRGDYWWHMDIWSKANINWAYIEDDDIRANDVCVCSCPFALTGSKHQAFDWLVDRCNQLGVKLLVDFIYLPNSNNAIDIDLSADCIQEITFSLSKTFPLQCAKVAVRMCKTKPQDPMQMSNDENICNRLSAGLALSVIDKFAVDYNVTKYLDRQSYWCNKLGLTPTPVIHFGLGNDYTDHGRSNTTAWCSPFNEQQNRYNLGMLFENEKLLTQLGFYNEPL
jgi:hypothetical protein